MTFARHRSRSAMVPAHLPVGAPGDQDVHPPNALVRLDSACSGEVLSVRDVVGALQDYEPVMGATTAAIRAYRRDPEISVVALASELRRVRESRIVLNRALREAVLCAVQERGLSLSEIAMRCGRAKRDARGLASGETSWLARRVGMLPESGASAPTPWVHSDVLGLIARQGLSISPREVELG